MKGSDPCVHPSLEWLSRMGSVTYGFKMRAFDTGFALWDEILLTENEHLFSGTACTVLSSKHPCRVFSLGSMKETQRHTWLPLFLPSYVSGAFNVRGRPVPYTSLYLVCDSESNLHQHVHYLISSHHSGRCPFLSASLTWSIRSLARSSAASTSSSSRSVLAIERHSVLSRMSPQPPFPRGTLKMNAFSSGKKL